LHEAECLLRLVGITDNEIINLILNNFAQCLIKRVFSECVVFELMEVPKDALHHFTWLPLPSSFFIIRGSQEFLVNTFMSVL